ncbi:hypothetical protein Q4489_04315 [Thalassotalea sp. 1_MG-2023]|uniref:hypothetical protein n=1 Tax=Thalassotalea sp. 1_MG-2023 TaxID=3062680 RepID=UPI0026E27FC0|nr:hypothetical protein [Thalassotalea sp. 1_MG-2023]MDO6426221.1 hypothetical protein [Thalassotalea sp. 1_MG-2023]
MLCGDYFLQRNDQVLVVPVTREGQAIETANLSEALYKLYSNNKRVVLLTKTLDDGISRDASTLSISISESDSENLCGTYYHELTIVDPVMGRSTAFKGDIVFQSTENKES